MLRVAVELPSDFTTPGEFLADAQAYEAAGAEAVWLGPPGRGPEQLTLLAAIAAVTGRLGLGTALAVEGPTALIADTVRTLDRLSRGRVILALDAGASELIEALRRAERQGPILVTDPIAAVAGDGLLHLDGDAAVAFEHVREQRPDAELQLWARVPAPGGRAAWRDALALYEELGATGIVVAHAANLLDILRNPEEDDRQDLAMAVG